MTISRKAEPNPLVVVFERDGEPSRRIRVANGKKALLQAVRTLLAHATLDPGDCVRIEAAGDGRGGNPPSAPARRTFDLL